jgi:hypothetical protein
MPVYNPMVGPPGAINNPRSLGAQYANPLGGLPGSATRPSGNQYGGVPTGGYMTPEAEAANAEYMRQRALQAPAGQAAFQQRGMNELSHLAGGGSRFGIMPGVPPMYQSGAPAQGGLSAASTPSLGGAQDNWVYQTGNALEVPGPTNFPTAATNTGLGGAVTPGTTTTPLPSDAPGGYGSNPGSPAFGAIQTSITPTNIYTQQQTNRQINQRRALAAQAASLPWLLQQGARQGVSQRSPSAIGRAIPQIGAMQTEIARAPVEQQFADDAANIDHYRAGQVAREQEAQGLAGGLLRMQDMNRVLQGTRGSILSSLLSRFM